MLASLFLLESKSNNLPNGLLDALCYVESSHKEKAIHHDDGNGDSLGICQIKLNTAKFLKFKGSEQDLLKAKINIHYSALYLKYQLERYNGDIKKAVGAYNSGTYKIGKDQNPINSKYIQKVLRQWKIRTHAKSKTKI